MTAAVEATGLGKRYVRRWGLRDCTFAVPAGRIAALVGPNGSGKSTLLRMAAGFSRPTTGEITVAGHRPRRSDAASLAAVAYLDQDRPLYPGFRVAEMLDFGRRANPRFDRGHATDVLGAAGIDGRARIHQLSAGQAALVALVLCLAKQPDVLLLDEPVAALDPLARRRVMEDLLQAVVDRGTTVLLASHVVSELEDVCDYAVILSASRVQVADDIERLQADHRVLVGPRDSEPGAVGGASVVSATRTSRQATVVVRGRPAVTPDGWEVLEPTLEEVVLAYLAADQAGRRPGGEPA